VTQARPRGQMLLCPPDYFDVTYSINPWMKPEIKVDKERAAAQWKTLCAKLAELSVTVEIIDPVAGLPDMTFAGDGGFVHERTFVPSNFRHPERQPEAAHYERWFAARGYQIVRLREDIIFEGLGDVTLNSGRGIISYGQRSTIDAAAELGRIFSGIEWLATVELVDPRFFHIGVALQLLDADTGVYVPGAFSADSRKVIERLPLNMIPVTDADAENMTVNAIVVDRDLVVNYCSAGVERRLRDAGFTVHRVDVSEFLKSGGATRCLVLAMAY
jgi:N-dimethylarginine dimethylaminohydrolase